MIDHSKPVITKQYLGNIVKHHYEGNLFYFYDTVSCLQVKVLSDSILRIKLAPHGTFLAEFSYATQPYDFRIKQLDHKETPTHHVISTAAVHCYIDKQTFGVTFTDHQGLIVNEDGVGIHWEENQAFGGYYVYCSKKRQLEENFYGLGDKTTELNLLGKRYTLWSTDVYAFEKYKDPIYRNVPFYTGLHHGVSYGLFFDNTFRSHFDFGSENRNMVSFWADGGEMQYYYIHGPHMMDVVKRYSQITGTHPMPPLWALGYQQCRWSYYPEEKVMQVARTFREKEIPCDAIHLDIDYMDGYRCFTWNKDYFPDPKRMIGELAADGFKTVVIIDPGIKVDNDYWVFAEGKRGGHFCRRGDDYYMEGPVWPGKCQFPDFTNPRTREWWGDLFKDYVDLGVAGVWNDMNEPAVFGKGTFPDDVRHHYDGHRGSHRKAHNVYGMQMVRATYEGLKKLNKNKRPFTITRSAYAGVQRYSSVWTGDNIASWEHLQLANLMCQRLSMSGISFVGSDIGGFTSEPDGELYTRWLQMAAFHPLMRTHSAGDTTEREPWSFGPVVEAICKKYIELRYRLLPYLYSAFWENSRYGFPILRPVVMLEQGTPLNAYRQDEFTFGDKILVCPVIEPRAAGRVVYLPRGNWYNYWTNEVLEGGHEHWVAAPLDTLPLFVRAGAVIPEYPLMQYTNQFELKELILSIYYADYGVNSFLYEDHGDTFAYEQDIYTEKKFYLEGSKTKLFVTQQSEGLFTPRYDRYLIRLYGLPYVPKKIKADDDLVTDLVWDKKNETLQFRVLKSFQRIEIE
ncbi:MAG: DUF4968 domain-containing protein [Ferruginibacter sp.]|nr:DUF4968 domain-containing protein [Cytophagales bacterium]